MAGPGAIAGAVTAGSGEVGARERILRTAYELFSLHGLNVVGVDRIAAESGVAKTTLYRHFQSREGLVLAVLELHEALWTRAWLEQEVERRARTPRTRLLAIFDAFGDWFDEPSFEGCLFTNVLIETHNHSSPIRVSAVKRLATIRDLVQTYADGAGIPEPEAFANQLQIVMFGSIIAAVDGRRESATQARQLAKLLVEQALP
jgi:AcrR family transcriptional regulator